MSIEELEECISQLRYVSKGDAVLSRDFNTPVKCLKTAHSILENPAYSNIVDSERLKQLEDLLYQWVDLRALDKLYSHHHNYILNALWLTYESIKKHPKSSELREILSKIEYVTDKNTILPEHHNLIVDAIKKIREIIQVPPPCIIPLECFTNPAITFGVIHYIEEVHFCTIDITIAHLVEYPDEYPCAHILEY